MFLFCPDFRVYVHLRVAVVRVRQQGWKLWPMQSVCEHEEVQTHCKQHWVDPDTLKQRELKWAAVCLLLSSNVLPGTNQSSVAFNRFLKPNISHFKNQFCFLGVKQCAFRAILIHSFFLTDLDGARPCGATVEYLTTDQQVCVQISSRSKDFNQDSSLL